MGDEDDNVIYPLPSLLGRPAVGSPPAGGRRPMETKDRRKSSDPVDREMTDDSTMIPRLLEGVGGLLKNRPMQMKPGRFDGTGSLESFLSQFEVCARHNRWTTLNQVDFLRCSLEKA